jgi:hypothetical protein
MGIDNVSGNAAEMRMPSNKPGNVFPTPSLVMAPPEPPVENRIVRNAERFDEVLLTHHRCFAGHDCVATGARVLQRIDEDPPAFAEAQQIVPSQNVDALRGTLNVPATWAASAMLSKQ